MAANTCPPWMTEQVVRLIDLYEERPCLYSTRSKEYSNRDKRAKAIKEISEALDVAGMCILVSAT